MSPRFSKKGIFVVVHSLSHVQLFATPWTAECQASLSFTISRSLVKLLSIESVMPSNHLILCCPFSSCLQSFSPSGSFPMNKVFASSGQSIGASASVLPMNYPLTLCQMHPVSSAHLYNTLPLVVVQSLSHVWLFATQWTAIGQASLSFTISQNSLKFMFIELAMSSNHLVL